MSTSRDKINCILAGRNPGRPGFWLGNSADETKEIYRKELNIKDNLTQKS